MAKKPMSDAQKYKPANARGAGPGAEGRAKIKTGEKVAKKYGEDAAYGLRTEGSRLLGQDYARSIGGKGEKGMYKNGGMVAKGKPMAKAAGKGKLPAFLMGKKGK